MPIYMDLHILPGVTARDVAKAHLLDMMEEEAFGCKCMTYWIDEERGHVFCLIEAPDQVTVEHLHSKSHGLVPNRIIEVKPGLVHSFLGRLGDPSDAARVEDNLLLINEPAFRMLVVIKIPDPVLLKMQDPYNGRANAEPSLNDLLSVVLQNNRGSRVALEGITDMVVLSFVELNGALKCALQFLTEVNQHSIFSNTCQVAIHAGEPVAGSEKLFGETMQMARALLFAGNENTITVSTAIRELMKNLQLNQHAELLRSYAPSDENFLLSMYKVLEEHACDPDFGIDQFYTLLHVSNSQLYRKSIQLTGKSPNDLIREMRLQFAKGEMGKQLHTISQIAYQSGFNSHSYFAKCFKEFFKVLPQNYLEHVKQ